MERTTARRDAGEAPITLRVYCICAFGAFGGILFGYDSGYISGVLAMDQFKLNFGSPGSSDPTAYQGYMYATWQKSLITSILSLGTFLGAMASGSVADWIGRRTTIIMGCGIYVGGVVAQTIALNVTLLTIGRAIAGLGVGFVSAVVILYVSEITPKSIRGSIIASYQLAITTGLLLAAVVNKATMNRMDTGAFRIPIALQFLWALILASGLACLPESPRWYVRRGDRRMAAEALARLMDQPSDHDLVQAELNDLVRNYIEELRKGGGNWSDCFRGGFGPGSNLLRTFLGMSIQMMQQLTGVNFIFYYGTTFFLQAGIKNAFFIAMIITIVNVCSTPIGILTIDRLGRRPLLIYGAIGMCICEFIVAIVGTLCPPGISSIVLVMFVCLYIFFFASTWGPTAWAVSGEIFPLTIRSKGVALATASNWLWNFIIGMATPYLVDHDQANLGSKVFFIWGSTCAACVLYAYFFVYETKGLSLEDVDKMMVETKPWTSAHWRLTHGESRELRSRGRRKYVYVP